MKRLTGILMASTLFLCATSATLAVPRISSDVTVTPQTRLTDQEKESVSIAAARLLIHVDQARKDLHAKNVEEAKLQVEKATTLADIVKSVMPAYTITTEVKSGNKDYVDQSNVKPLLVTLVEDLDEVAVLEPVRIAKQEHVAKMHEDGKLPVAADVELRQGKARLDVGMAIAQLDEATKALTENNIELADKELGKIQTHDVIFEYTVAEMPLARVQANLLLAKEAIKEKKMDEAQAALQVASSSLKEYGKTVGPSRTKEVQAMRAEIAALTNNLQANEQSSETSINKWWQKVATWHK